MIDAMNDNHDVARERSGSDGASPSRRHPAHGVIPAYNKPTIVYVTVCTKGHRPWLASHDVHEQLKSVWMEANAWLVGRYVIMPDHIHLFAGLGPRELPLENWVRYWKSRFTMLHNNAARRWQADHWDTRLRGRDGYDSKWEYVRNNPVRHGLVATPDEWPFQGEIYPLPW